MRLKRTFAAVAAFATIGVSGALAGAQPASAATSISGSLSCASGRPVTGIWVNATSSTDGWAPKTPGGGTSSTVSWTYSLSAGGSYKLHVGCGGTTQNWASTSYSATISGNAHSMICYDTTGSVPVPGWLYTCRL